MMSRSTPPTRGGTHGERPPDEDTQRQQQARPEPGQERWQDADELRWAARHWAVRIGVKTPRIQVRRMRSKWASISTAGRLTLNDELVRIPKRLGEFVIVHELVHLLAPNHGKVFKSFMHAYLPDWQARERELHRHGHVSGRGRGMKRRLEAT
jgi:predicted metal-dependent hydrolase